MKITTNSNKPAFLIFGDCCQFEVYFTSFVLLSHSLVLLIVGNVLNVFDVYCEQIIVFEKATYVAVILWFVFYYSCYYLRHKKLRFNICHWLIMIYFLIIVLSTVVYERNFLFDKFPVYEAFMTLIFFFSSATRVSDDQFKRMMTITGVVYCFVIFALNLASLYFYFFPSTNPSFQFLGFSIKIPSGYLRGRFGFVVNVYPGYYWNTGVLCLECCTAVLLTIFLFSIKRFSLFFAVISLLFNGFMIMVSFSRTAFIMIGVILVFAIFRFMKRKYYVSYKNMIIYSIVIVITLVTWFLILKRDAVNQMILAVRGDPYSYFDLISSGRLGIISVALGMVTNPYLGMGWVRGIPTVNSAGKEQLLFSTHMVIADVFVRTGIIGSCIFLGFIFAVIKRIKTISIEKNYWLVCMVVCFFVGGMFEQIILLNSRKACTYFFWLVLGYLISEIAPKQNAQLAEI